jgi:hypothetical protein
MSLPDLKAAKAKRIIQASSNPGDVVLDPFCGCGTTIDAAEKLGRDWIGIDVTQLAISLIKNRLQDTYGRRLKFISGGAHAARVPDSAARRVESSNQLPDGVSGEPPETAGQRPALPQSSLVRIMSKLFRGIRDCRACRPGWPG